VQYGEWVKTQIRLCKVRGLVTRVRGGFLYKLGVVSYTIRILMYPACILHVSWRIHVSRMYPDVSQMYLTCSVTFQENTCILHILHVFYTYPKRVQDTFWDTHQIHQDTCILGASLVSHWIHVRIHQDTSRYVYLGLFIRIHQDTPRYKITIHVSWTRHYEYMWDTCKDLCGIHVGYMYLQWFQDT